METHKILIIGPGWIGDMVMAQSLFKQLKQNHPSAEIDVLAPKFMHALLAHMPEVHQALPMPLTHGELGLLTRYRIGKRLRKNAYQQAIILPNSFKSALIPFFARVPKRTGWRGEWRYGLLNDLRPLDKKRYPLMIERFMALGLPKNAELIKPYPHPKLTVDAKQTYAALKKHNLQPLNTAPILALCPGAAFGSSKRWPPKYFAEVAKHKLNQGFQIWIFGSENDEPLAQTIQENTQHRCMNLAGKTTLGEAIDLLSLSQIVLSNDSGLMHIASALNLPLVVIYGSSSPKFTPPLTQSVKILSLNLECSPCFKRECPLKHEKCLRDLKPAMVINALKEPNTP